MARAAAMLNDQLFIGSIRKTLEEFPIADFNPGEHAPVNAAKKKALAAMESETERACRHFKEDCETDLAAREDIQDEASDFGKRPINSNHLTRAVENAGMVSTIRRVRFKGYRKTVVVVRNHDIWTREAVMQASPEAILKAMGKEQQG